MNPASRYVLEDDSPFPTGYFEGFLSLKGASYHHIHGLVGLVVFSGDPAVLKISQASGSSQHSSGRRGAVVTTHSVSQCSICSYSVICISVRVVLFTHNYSYTTVPEQVRLCMS